MSALAEQPRSELTPFDPLHPVFIANPYGFYTTCRESEPVHREASPEPPGHGDEEGLRVRGVLLHDHRRFLRELRDAG